MQLPPQYFENKKEQSQIGEAILKAIPENVYYHNLIIAMTELLAGFVARAYKEDVFKKSMSDKRGEESHDQSN